MRQSSPRSAWQRMAMGYGSYYSLLGLLQPYLPPTLFAQGLSPARVGLLLSACALATTVAPIAVARASAKYRWRAFHVARACAAAACLFAGALWTLRAAPSTTYVIALFLFTAAWAPLAALYDTLAVRVSRVSDTSFGGLRLIGSVGYMAASSLAGAWVAPAPVPRFLGTLGVLAAVLWLSTFALPRIAEPPPPRRQAAGFWSQFTPAWWLWLTAMALHWFTFGPYQYGLSLLIRAQGVPARATGMVWSVGVLSELLFFLASGKLITRFGPRRVLAVALAATGARWVLVGAWPSPWMIVATQLLHGPGFALFYASAMQAIADFSGRRNQMAYQGLFTGVVTGAATTLGIAFAGWLHTWHTLEHVFLAAAPVELAALGVLFYAGAPTPVPPPPRETAPLGLLLPEDSNATS
ncbi:MAG TPA: MFS transporter [Myxococcota bacterium]|nr:MFS transporter [Myxococcota bacterium]